MASTSTVSQLDADPLGGHANASDKLKGPRPFNWEPKYALRSAVLGAAALCGLSAAGVSAQTAPAADSAVAQDAVRSCAAGSTCGAVVDPSGNTIAFTQINVEYEDEVQVIFADENGVFVIADPRTPVRVVIARDDLELVSLDFASFLANGNIITVSGADDGGSSIIVNARRVSQPFARQTLTQLDILTNPLANADALLAVAGLASATNLDNSADVQLRGSAIGLSRVYYNDVPLYEIVRGSSVDQVTRVSSILSTSILSDVETYASLPPVYLANGAAGAVRALPNIEEDSPSSVFIGLPGASASGAFNLPNGAAQIYGNAIDLRASLALNPGLKRVTRSYTSLGAGAAVRIDLPSGGEINTLNVLDFEEGVYPLNLLNLSGNSRNERRRFYTLVGAELPVGPQRLKLDSAVTATRNTLEYRGDTVAARNTYLYANADFAGSFGGGIGNYRAGLTGELFNLRAAGTLAFGEASTGFREVREESGYAAAFVFVSVKPANNLVLSAGTRQFLASVPDLDASYSFAATYTSPDQRHKLIAGFGRFTALVPQEILTIAPVRIATSEQASIDYELRGQDVELRFGAYLKEDTFNAVLTRVRGFDGSFAWHASGWLDLSGSIAHARQRSEGFAGDRDLDFIIRLQARTRLSDTLNFNASFTTRSGARFTRVTGGIDLGNDQFGPIFDSEINGQQLRDFTTLDINLIKRLELGPSLLGPFVFVGITNLLDRRNESRAIFSNNFDTEGRTFFERRALTFGLSHAF